MPHASRPSHGSEHLDHDATDGPVLITEAQQSLDDQHRARVRKYLVLMSFRIPALLLAAIAYGIWQNALISLALVAVSIPLPWIAVLIANDRPPRRKDEPSRWDGRREHDALGQPHRAAIESAESPDGAAGEATPRRVHPHVIDG